MRKKILKLVGRNIQKFRKVRGYTQESLSEAADVHPATIGRYECGSINLTVLKLEKIADVLGVKVKDLFND